MPTYEFVCKSCEQQYEENRPVGDFDSKCPVCGGEVKKLVSAPNVVISGSTADSIIGKDAEKKWQEINDRKAKRNEEYFGNTSGNELKAKDQQRQSHIIDRQNKAFNVIDKAKKEAGVTKREEISHLLKG